MTDTIARTRVGSHVFETMVDMESAMKFRKGEEVSISDVIRDTAIWKDLKKGLHAGKGELENAFKTDVFEKIVEKIVKKGEIEVTQEHRDAETEQRRKQVIDFLVRNAIDSRTNNPFTPDMIDSALNQAGVKIENQPVERQLSKIMEGLSKIIPIKIETKKIGVKIPAEHTGKAYGIINEFKEKENWGNEGSLEVVLNIPVGLQNDFYDKLNSVTHGSAITKEMKEE